MDIIKYLKETRHERRNLRGGVAIDKPGGFERDWRIPQPNQWALQLWRENTASWRDPA